MNTRALVICRTVWQLACRQLAIRWVESWPLPRTAMRGLELPLLPSALARLAGRSFCIAQLLFAVELAWSTNWLACGSVVAAVLAFCWASARARKRRGRQLRRLMLSADARLHGLAANGAVVPLRVHPSSMMLGRWLLLRVAGEGYSQLLVLGPDNVDAPRLAELRRRLAFPVAADFD